MSNQYPPRDELRDHGATLAAVAVVGMACRVPGARSTSEFWQLLSEGREGLSLLTEEELRTAGASETLIRDPRYVRAGMFLKDMEQFDPGFFGLSPLDGKILDPQHRHFLECSWEAFENAGYDPTRFAGSIGVFAGSGHNAYFHYNVLADPDLVSSTGFFLLRHTGNDKDFLSTRVSYCFDLKGPSVNVQTACSTSLVAVHMASQSLLNGECDMALAGGVSIELPHRQGYLFREGEILSSDGHCRPFDASAGGTVFGSGVVVVLLKRLDDAIAAGDTIHGVIRASAVNNDGAGKISYLAPSVDGQAAAAQEALAIGEIDPRTVTYIEAHGTGTQLGDPIEIAALTQAYGEGHDQKQFCRVGSLKSNIGHLDTAAGVASLIKVLLSMQHKTLPPTLHFKAPNPAIDFPKTPFRVNSTASDWSSQTPLRAGVSSLGVGGTNAHVIVEEAPERRTTKTGRKIDLLLFSARTDSALLAGRDSFAQFFTDPANSSTLSLNDTAYTLAVGRREFKKRAFIVADGTDTAAQALTGQREGYIQGEAPTGTREVAFMFAGGGAQYPGMGYGLYTDEPVYRSVVDECFELLRPLVPFDLKSILFPGGGGGVESSEAELERPSRTLPALFITQYAQARLWQSWGVNPSALIGHSLGENTAACLAGVLSLKDALALVALRGRLFETIHGTGMLGLELSEEQLTPMLGNTLSLAAVNAPSLVVASGPTPALLDLERNAEALNVGYNRVRIAIAAHSSMLESVLQPFGDYLRSITLHEPQIPFISNLTGDWITPEQATGPEYWVEHLRNTVRFSKGITTLLALKRYVFLEVGPGRTLATLASMNGTLETNATIITSMHHPEDHNADLSHMLGALGKLWIAGAEISWSDYYGEGIRNRVQLPTYCFDHVPCWITPKVAPALQSNLPGDVTRRGKTTEEFLFQRVWQRVSIPADYQILSQARVLVFVSEVPVGAAVVAALKKVGADLRVVRHTLTLGEKYSLRADAPEDFSNLISELKSSDWLPSHILHLWALDLSNDPAHILQDQERALAFDSLFHLAQAFGMEGVERLAWCIVTSTMLQVSGESVDLPLAALALGPVRVLPQEFPDWQTRLVDIDLAADSSNLKALADSVCSELAHLGPSTGKCAVVARRSTHRFVEAISQVPESSTPPGSLPPVRSGCVYLITGGTGGLGLVAARMLAAATRITLVLTSHRTLPQRSEWKDLLRDQAPDAATLTQLVELEKLGTIVVLDSLDITDEAAVRALKDRLSALGTLRGIIHTAGVIDDELLVNKNMTKATRVFAPKLKGSVVLDRVFRDDPLDFFVLYSSTSALAGLPGQIDYAAANSFLDAFAHFGTSRGVKCISINWSAWRGSGMAADLATGHSQPRLPAGRPVLHPFIDRSLESSETKLEYLAPLKVGRDWILSEHRIKDGPALLPGSAFLELAYAAWHDAHPGDHDLEMTDVSFEFPFVVGERETRVMHVSLEDAPDSCNFTLHNGESDEPIVHARGMIRPQLWREQQIDLEAIRLRCAAGTQRFDDPLHHPHLEFGSRWASLSVVRFAPNEALIELNFPGDITEELSTLRLHPALVDMATAGAQVIINGHRALEEFYVPVGYRRIRMHGVFPSQSFSHVVLSHSGLKAHDNASGDSVEFDILVANSVGSVFLSIEGFRMQRLPGVQSFRDEVTRREPATPPMLERALELGLNVEEGSQALQYLLDAPFGAQVVVSPFNPHFIHDEVIRAGAPQETSKVPSHDPDADPENLRIAGALQGIPAIEQVIVRCFLDAAGNGRFVAFFTPCADNYVTISDIRRIARTVLEPSCVPQQFVEVDEIPRNLTGTIDRAALRDPLAQEKICTPPKTATEKTLGGIWAKALGVSQIGLEDNFFDLGGYSLLSIRVIVQIYKRLNVKLDQATMVLNTLEQVAREIDQRLGVQQPQRAAGGEAGVDNQQAPQPTPQPSSHLASVGSGFLRSLFGGAR